MQENVQEVAFADDKVMLFAGNSRQSIQEKAQSAINVMTDWCSNNKMELSSTKTVMIQLKGSLDIRRPPLVAVNGKRIQMVKSVKWLGVDFDERLGVTSHVKRIAESSKKIFFVLKRVAKERWGLRQNTLGIIYEGLVVASMTYGCAGWADRMNCHHRRTLISAQRAILLGITKAYRTVSTDAVTVLAGVIPIDILLNERLARFKIRRREDVSYENIHVLGDQIRPNILNKLKKDIRKASIATWQNRWNQSVDGRLTFGYLPNVSHRLENKLSLSAPFTQMLSGHGKFAVYMHRFGLSDSSSCDCGNSSDSADHILYDCDLASMARNQMINDLNLVWPVSKLVLMQPNNIQAFKKFCDQMLSIRSELTIHQAN